MKDEHEGTHQELSEEQLDDVAGGFAEKRMFIPTPTPNMAGSGGSSSGGVPASSGDEAGSASGVSSGGSSPPKKFIVAKS